MAKALARTVAGASLAVLSFAALPCHAEEASATPPEPLAPRAWLFADDATIAAPGRITTVARVTMTGGSAASRPFAADLAHPGGAYEAGAEVGIVRGISLQASGVTTGIGADDAARSGMMAGLRVSPFANVVVSAGYLRELAGASGVWARLSLARDIGRARIATTVHTEHMLSAGRDGLDVMVMAGATYRVAGPLRLGAEYVAQDLEGAFDSAEAEQGVRHFAGPTVAVELPKSGVTISGGPAAGLSPGSPPVLGRLAVACSF